MDAWDLTDGQIESMTAVQRKELIERLERPTAELIPPRIATRIRIFRMGLMLGGSIGLIPWIFFLALTLPDRYVARNWSATWVGFDVLLVTLMAITAALAWQRRRLLVLPAFATGILLLCDAWFDIMTAEPGDVWVSVATAVFGEIPLAALLIVGTLQLMRLMSNQLWLLQPGTRLWQLRLPY